MQELVKINAPRALTLGPEAAQAVQEAFAVNIAGGSVSEFDLPRIKVNPGTALWLIPTLEGEETAQRIEGVIVFARDTRAYYQSKDAGNVPPDCSSSDNVTGVGKPGGQCAQCPLARWDSAGDGSGAQACKQVKQLFMLRGEAMFPEVVSLPPTSVRNARQFFLKLTTQGIPYYQAFVAIELEKAQNGQGKTYGKAVLKFLRRLTPEETQRAVEFHQMCQQFAGRIPTTTSAAEANADAA
ncbi:MAG TPA: hypothetical protein PLA43_20605 [Bryobacteraceae bacterium]|jgi:hypothetical protein|nr:hypothetical protein [Bryobacteraceae bacterium]